jgi:hypothetical protein
MLRAIELRLSSNSICQDLHTDPYSDATIPDPSYRWPHITGRPHVVYLDKE